MFTAALAAGLPLHGFWEWPAVIGVSGGADSVGVLVALEALGRLRPVLPRLIVAHAHHGLRAEADGDLDFVVALGERLGLRVVTARLPVLDEDGVRGEGLEARARRLRYDWLGIVAGEAGARNVVVAHTADDQAETILQRALRGTGVAGLAGMTAARPLFEGVALLRPMLAVRRAEVRRFLSDSGQTWREDATNADLRLARSFLRHEIIDRAEKGPFPAATEALVRLGSQAALVAGAIADAASSLLEAHSRRLPGGNVVIDAGALAARNQHLLAELFVALWRREAWGQRDMTAAHYRLLVHMLHEAGRKPGSRGIGQEATSAGGITLPGGIRAMILRQQAMEIRPAGASR